MARSTVLAGVFSSLLMALIYLLSRWWAPRAAGPFPAAANGGEALAQIAEHYFGAAGALILAATRHHRLPQNGGGAHHQLQRDFRGTFPQRSRLPGVGGDLLRRLLPHRQPGPQHHPQLFTPVLMFLYPLSIVLILLTLGGRLFGNHPTVLRWTIGCTAGGGAGRPAAHPAGGHPGGAPPGGRRDPGRNLAAPLQGGLRLVGARPDRPRHRSGAAPGAPLNFFVYNHTPAAAEFRGGGVLCL